MTQQMYKDHMNVMVNRVNTLNGAAYSNALFSSARLVDSALLRTGCLLTDGMLPRRALWR